MKQLLFIFLMLTNVVFSNNLSMDNLDQLIEQTTVNNATTEIVIDRATYVENNLVIPEHINLIFKNGGYLVFKEGEKITINGKIIANNQKIFQFASQDITWNDKDHSITFNNQNKVRPEWWGIFPNKVPNNVIHYILMKQMMLDLKASNGATVLFSKGTYYMRDLVVDFSNVNLIGEGEGTVLKFDEKNFIFKSTKSVNGKNVSTRQGALVMIRGPHKNGQGNFAYNESNYAQIENVSIENLKIEYTDAARLSDTTMNGLGIMNAKHVLVKNVTVDMHNANRGFYVGIQQKSEQTEDIKIVENYVVNSRTGVFITHGFPEKSGKDFKSGKVMKDIYIANNSFNLSSYNFDLLEDSQIALTHRKYVDLHSSGVFISGNDYTQSVIVDNKQYDNYLGKITIEKNSILNADIGIRSSIPVEAEKHNSHLITVSLNEFIDFKYFGVFGAFKNAEITNNVFDTNVLSKPPTISNKNFAHFYTDKNYAINLVNKIGNNVENDNFIIAENDFVNLDGQFSNLNTNNITFNYDNKTTS